MNLPDNTKNISGKRFGRLVAISPTDKRINSSIVWECICDCGNKHRVPIKSLNNGSSKSCGCMHKETLNFWSTNGHVKKAPGEASFNALLGTYKSRARKKKVDFSLSNEEFRQLTSSNCAYCGQSPNQFFDEAKSRYNGRYLYNGIDRKDHTIGYTKENSTPCCKRCNYAKHTMNEDEFIDWITKVYNYQLHRED